MSKYESTHPWLTFSIDLRKADPRLWILLGECKSKSEHIAGVPLVPGTAQKLHEIYLAKGVSATTAIEGNTLSEQDVQKQLRGELHLPPSREYLARETDNIIAMCNLILERLKKGDPPAITPDWICELNRTALRGLRLEPEVIPGELRKHSVGVMNYRGAPVEDCGLLLERLSEWLSGPVFQPPAPRFVAVYAIIKAVLAHLYLAWIHPFADGNGRTARLIEFQILLASGMPSPAAHLLSNHYNQTRSQYYRELDRASRSGGDVMPFLLYAAEGLADELKAQIDFIRGMQMEIMWRDYVYESFRGRKSPAPARQRDLALALANSPRPRPLADLAGLTPGLAREYARKTAKPLSRDVNQLVKMELIRKSGAGYETCQDKILSFLPFKTADAKTDAEK